MAVEERQACRPAGGTGVGSRVALPGGCWLAKEATGGRHKWVFESVVGRLGNWVEKEASSSKKQTFVCLVVAFGSRWTIF